MSIFMSFIIICIWLNDIYIQAFYIKTIHQGDSKSESFPVGAI